MPIPLQKHMTLSIQLEINVSSAILNGEAGEGNYLGLGLGYKYDSAVFDRLSSVLMDETLDH